MPGAGRALDGVIFDVDGVLVDSPHEQAWREALRELMEGQWRDVRDRTTWSPEAFTSAVYQAQISGRPRLSGARAALEYFHVPDEDGRRATELADRKQAIVLRLIEAGEVRAFPDAVRFVLAVKDAGLRMAVASSSKNAGRLLRGIRLDALAAEHDIDAAALRPGLTLLDLFDADVSGRDLAHGKPAPDLFLAAADELDLAPARAVVVEDAAAGVTAAKAGAMSAIGLARTADADDLLTQAGADLVVSTLDDVDVAALAEGRLVSAPAPARTPSRGAGARRGS